MSSPSSSPDVGDRETIVDAVVGTVADAEDVSPLALPPLATVIDPDALETLVASLSRGPVASAGSVAFAYSDHDVTVAGDGTVSVTEHAD